MSDNLWLAVYNDGGTLMDQSLTIDDSVLLKQVIALSCEIASNFLCLLPLNC